MSVDVAVVGGGHAGIEAALAAARMGVSVSLVTGDLQKIGWMPCNPAIGGVGKGQLVKEIDALGGEMGRAIDETGIQFRRLNTKKGPAVRSTRAQADMYLYAPRMQRALKDVERITLIEGMVNGLLIESSRVRGLALADGRKLEAKTVILTTGTFLNGVIHMGHRNEEAGRFGENPAKGLSESLAKLNLRLGRMKTGTVPRLDRKTIDFNGLEIQPGDNPLPMFSFFHSAKPLPQKPCWITYTHEKTHEIIRKNLNRSAMYSGKIQAIGPRYCPCIEDKVVRFAEREKHQIFLEPQGLNTDWIYPNGISNSLPEEVQLEFLRTIPGLENVEIFRPGYAVEYDFVDPTQLFSWLETKPCRNLFLGGQINGTSGYEEAAAQGLMAGINAALRVRGEDPFILHRGESYIGVLIDDLVTKGTAEPYRMFTSRVEHRLHIREDNADQRLHSYGKKLGLISDHVDRQFQKKVRAIHSLKSALQKKKFTPTEETNQRLASMDIPLLKKAQSLWDVLKRPEAKLHQFVADIPEIGEADPAVSEQVEIETKYEGYIARERESVEKLDRAENKLIPQGFDFHLVPSLSNEVREKLQEIKPKTLGQASRISGVTPAAVSILSIFVHRHHQEAGSKEVG